MVADTFTNDVYNKARDVITNQKFDDEWQKFISEKCGVKSLLAADGPNTANASGLDKLRGSLGYYAQDAGNLFTMVAYLFTNATKEEVATFILKLAKAGTPENKWRARAATLKALYHFTREHKRGGQDVWVYSEPMKYDKWVFAMLSGTEAAIEGLLKDNDEVFTAADKKTMCESLGVALKTSEDTKIKIAAPDATTKAVAKRWFADEDTTDAELDTFIGKLHDGFKKISNVLNSSTLVFCSIPGYRKDEGKFNRTRGSVITGGEGAFPVIALEGRFKIMGTSGMTWKCAKTIIHEASHHEVRTRDNARDGTGLKPDKAHLPAAKAQNNADSWAYFALDVCGKLARGDRDQVLKDWA